MAFEIEDLACSAATRADRNLNLGARLAQAIKSHEEEVRSVDRDEDIMEGGAVRRYFVFVCA